MRHSRRNVNRAWLLLLPFLATYALLVVVPTAGVFLKSFVTSHTLELELLNPAKLLSAEWTLSNYATLFTEPYYLTATWNTVVLAAIAVVAALAIGTPIAYLLTRYPKMPGVRYIEWVISLPVYMPGVLASYALFLFFSRQGLFGALTEAVIGNPIYLVRSFPGVVLGTVYVVLPMFVRVARAGFEFIRSDIGEASLTLGATEAHTFRKIILPLALPAVAAATVVAFTYAMSLVVVILILGDGGATFTILPLEILSVTRSFDMNVPLAAAMAIVLLVVAFVGQLAVDRLLDRTEQTEVSPHA